MDTSFYDRAFVYAWAQVMRLGKRVDPEHFDGGASLLMAILTLSGHRGINLHVNGGVALGCPAKTWFVLLRNRVISISPRRAR